jgi:hypothetical protein
VGAVIDGITGLSILKEIKQGFLPKWLPLSMIRIDLLGLRFLTMLMVKSDTYWHR